MISGNLTMNRFRDPQIDGRWSSRDGDVLVEVKRTNNVRDIRDGLLTLAYLLTEEPTSTTALLCVLTTQSSLSPTRLNHEVDRFLTVLRPDLVDRVRLIDIKETELGIRPPSAVKPGLLSSRAVEPDFLSWLQDLVARETTGVRANRQTVTSAIAVLWLREAEPMTLRSLQVLCHASYPTVANAVAKFTNWDLLEPRTDRRLLVRYIPVELWIKIAEQHIGNRKLHRFIDPTDQPKSPETLSAKLFKMQQQGLAAKVAVGGVLGARHYFSDLDITASPRLDLSLYGTGGLDFVRSLDAALEKTEDARAKATLVVHETSEPVRFIEHQDGTWASELECCSDLLEIGLTREAHEMMTTLSNRRLSSRKVHP